MTKAEILKLLENYSDDADFPGLNFPGDVPFDKAVKEELANEPAAAPEAKVEEKVVTPEGEAKEEIKEEAGYPVYTTSDDTGLVWKDPVAFKKFVAGPLLVGLEPEDRAAEMKRIMSMTPEELINDRDTADTYTSFMSDVKDDSGATVFDPNDEWYAWDKSLRDIYGDNDVFSPELLDFIDNYTEDVNNDGDTDLTTADTTGDGKKDTAVIDADDKDEAVTAVEKGKEELKADQDSTGSLNDKPQEDVSDIRKKRVEKMDKSWGQTTKQKGKECSDENMKDKECSDENVKDKKEHGADCTCAECSKKKEQEVSDRRFKNILGALQGKLW